MTKRVGAAAFLLALSGFSTARADESGSADWPMYNYDVAGTRNNTGEKTLGPWNASRLHQLWNVPTPAPVTGTPVVVADDLYVGDWANNFYKVSASSGHIGWTTQAQAPISASGLVLGDQVFFGDQAGFIYGLNRHTGKVQWTIRPNMHPLAAIFSSPTPVGRYIAIGIASNEEDAAGDPSYPCCSFRGSTVLLDPANGDVIWQTYFITSAQRRAGSSGNAVWSTPTYDEESGIVYVTTGNNYSAPATNLEDSIIALDACTGNILWANQAVSGDVSNFGVPIQVDKDSDYGDSVQIYRLANGRKVVSAGNKNGVYYVADARTGSLVGAKTLQTGGSLGGLFSDSAYAYGINFANGANWADPFDFTVLPTGGYVTAITGDGARILWQKFTPQKVDLSGVAVANGVVYFASANPGTGTRLTDSSGVIYAVDAFTGEELAAVPVGNCASSGPALANGRLFLGLGNEFLFAGAPTGNIVALGL
jgi:polyvinyl alcohol dehydrogenase (cytochrome)